MSNLQRSLVMGLAVILGSLACPALALAGVSALGVGIAPASVLTDSELASQRGGFRLDKLEISIGLEQVVSVNGETLAINRLNIPNLNQMVKGQAVTHWFETELGVIASGQDGALVSSAADSGAWMTLIQNNLNGSVIQNARQLNIELNHLGDNYRVPAQLREPLLQLLGR